MSENHPSLAGHFPGNPVVPGAVILNEVFMAMEKHWPEICAAGINFVKFIKPLLADQKVLVSFVKKDSDSINFVCKHKDIVLVSGKCKVTNKGES